MGITDGAAAEKKGKSVLEGERLVQSQRMHETQRS
jgi:hypothetical protein